MRSGKQFSWLRVIHKALKCPSRRFNFWWRIASHLKHHDSKIYTKIARKINNRLCKRYGIDIALGAYFGPGLKINHGFGIVIRDECIAGENLILRQNTTIGRKHRGRSVGHVKIGDNVEIGAHVCIIGDIEIGDNVIIGAMSLINKDIPNNNTAFNMRSTHLTLKK